MEGKGFRIYDLETYQVGGKTRYAGLFKPANYAKAALVGQSWDKFFQNWKNLEYQGLRMFDIETRSNNDSIPVSSPPVRRSTGSQANGLCCCPRKPTSKGTLPAKVKVSLQFDGGTPSWSFVLPLQAYANKNSTGSFAFPAHQSDLDNNEYWFMGSRGGHEGPKPWLGPDASERVSDAHRGALWDGLNEGNGAFPQQYAYDMGVVKWDGNKWASCDPSLGSEGGDKCTENEDFFVWGTPVYAMDDGVVLYCYRSAPNNPAPGEKATVPGEPGGGNMYWIQHTGGEIALYAHLQAGSVPADLCPTDGAQSAPYPVIHKGQRLGVAGNSGSSSGPHLHVHVQASWQLGDKGEGMPLLFNNISVSERVNSTSLSWQDADHEAVAADDSNVAQSAESDTLIKIDQ